MLGEAVKGVSVYQKSVPLPPGMYRLNVVAKDIVGRQHEQLRNGAERSAL